MPNIIVYLNEELYQKFRKEENKSGLVSGLLEDFYRKTIKPDISEIKSVIEIKTKEIEKLEEVKQKVQVENHIQEIEEKKRIDSAESRVKSKIESIRKNASAFFPTFASLNQIEQDKLINDSMQPENGDLNLVQFFNSKGFKDNIPENG